MFFCRNLTSVPHVAGTKWDKEQAEWVRDRFLEAGLDEAKTVPYEILLSYPSTEVVNQVSLLDNRGVVQFTTIGKQPAILNNTEESSNDILFNFHGYSGHGVVEVVHYYYAYQFYNLHLSFKTLLG